MKTETEHRIITENIDDAFELIRRMVDDPDGFEDIPNGANIILIPTDDPERAHANFELAKAKVNRGEQVMLRPVGKSTPAETT